MVTDIWQEVNLHVWQPDTGSSLNRNVSAEIPFSKFLAIWMIRSRPTRAVVMLTKLMDRMVNFRTGGPNTGGEQTKSALPGM